MIRCFLQSNALDPKGGRTSWIEEWGPECTPMKMLPRELREHLEQLACYRNGNKIKDTDWHKQCTDGDLVTYVFEPHGAFGVIFILLSVAFTLRSLGQKQKKPAQPGEIDSTTYGFGGAGKNQTKEGSALPIVYGEMRVAGVAINVWTTAPALAEHEINMLIALSGSEVEMIGDQAADTDALDVGGTFLTGVQINEQPAETFTNITAGVRLGTPEQTPMGVYQEPTLQFPVGKVCTPTADDTSIEATAGNWAPSHAQITKWDTFVSYTMVESGDVGEVTLLWPSGLFDTNASAQEIDASVDIQIRYIAVDGSGTAFGEYLVLDKAPTITYNQSKEFRHTETFRFYEPSSYTTPTQGNFYILDGTDDYASIASPSGIPATPTRNEMTVMLWVRLDWTRTGDVFDWSNAEHSLVNQHDGVNKGFKVRIKEDTTASTNRYIQGRWTSTNRAKIEVELGNGTTFTTFSATDNGLTAALGPADVAASSGNGAKEGQWCLISVAYSDDGYQRYPGGVPNFPDVQVHYNDGVSLIAESGPYNADHYVWANTSPIIIGGDDSTPTIFFQGDIDEVVFWQVFQFRDEVRLQYNGGAGRLTPEPATRGPVVGWHFDGDALDFVASNDLTLNGSSAVSASDDGPVPTNVIGTPRRGTYRIEIQRLTEEGDSQFSQDEFEFESFRSTLSVSQSYPGVALLGITMRATDQLSGSIPLVTALVRGTKCPVWDGVDPYNPVINPTWTRNPAWIIADIALNKEYGLGDRFSVDDIDWSSFMDYAVFCDEKASEEVSGSVEFYSVNRAASGGSWPGGYLEIVVHAADVPPAFSEVTDGVIASEDATHYMGIDTSNDATGAPANWLELDHDGKSYPVGEVSFGVAADSFFYKLHLPNDPGVKITYEPTSPDITYCTNNETRMQFDGVFDRANLSAWDAILRVASSARGIPILVGTKLGMVVDHVQPGTALVSMGNIIKGSFEQRYVGFSTRPNVELVEFLDRDDNFHQSQVEMEHSTANDPGDPSSLRRESYALEGVTRRSQVLRHIRQNLNTSYLSIRAIKFKVSVDSLALLPGDVFFFAHDVPGWGVSGRLLQHSSSQKEMFLDRAVTLETAINYEIQIRSGDTGLIQTLGLNEGVTGGPGTYQPGSPIATTQPFTFTPKQGDLYSFGRVSKVNMQYRVTSIQLDPKTLEKTIEAEEYSSDFFSSSFPALPAAITNLPAPSTS